MFAAILLILIISFLVLIHEFGHFFSAKKLGVRVEEFGIGLPPKIFGKKKGETTYSVNLLPFGGFVKLTGEDAENLEAESTKKDPKNFMSKSPFKRGVILTAGVFMNLMLAILLWYVFFGFNGYKTTALPLFFDYKFAFGEQREFSTVISALEEGSGAESAGLRVGEAIIEIDKVPVYTFSDVKRELVSKSGEEVSVLLMDMTTYSRDVRAVNANVRGNEEGEGILGVLLGKAVVLDYSNVRAFAGPMHAYNILGYSINALKGLAKISVDTKDITPISSSVSGPVGIFSIVDNILVFGRREVALRIIDLIALLSLSLAFINILPFPALDGGRLVFVSIEMVFKKRVSQKFESNVHKWGMIFLLGLLFLITFKDISDIIF